MWGYLSLNLVCAALQGWGGGWWWPVCGCWWSWLSQMPRPGTNLTTRTERHVEERGRRTDRVRLANFEKSSLAVVQSSLGIQCRDRWIRIQPTLAQRLEGTSLLPSKVEKRPTFNNFKAEIYVCAVLLNRCRNRNVRDIVILVTLVLEPFLDHPPIDEVHASLLKSLTDRVARFGIFSNTVFLCFSGEHNLKCNLKTTTDSAY